MKKLLMLGIFMGLGLTSLDAAALYFLKIENKLNENLEFTGKLPGGWDQPDPRFPFYIHPKSIGFDITTYGKQDISNKMRFSNVAIPPKGYYLQIKVRNDINKSNPVVIFKIWDENWEVHVTKNGKKYKTAPFQANDKYFNIKIDTHGELFIYAVRSTFGTH